MSNDSPATATAAWAEAMTHLVQGAPHVGHTTLHAQGAFGWMFRGRPEDARSMLQKMPTVALAQVAAAAMALSMLADEVAAGKGT